MGKGDIISGGDAGRYSIQLDYDTTRIAYLVAVIDAKIAFYEDQIEALIDTNAIARRKLWIASLQKRKAMLEDSGRCPTDRVVTAWCADLTEDLTGTVGTIEIESQTGQVLIRPGYDGNAVYDAARDGQMQAMLGQHPAAALLNRMFHDARQKWAPRHRVGVLTAVDHEADTCSVTLDAAAGAMTGSDINRDTTLVDVPIEYMTCNSAPFESGDRVVVEFTDNAWDDPVVTGFEANPKACAHDYVIISAQASPWDPDTLTTYTPDEWAIVWDTGTGRIAEQIPASATPEDYLSFPCKTADLAYWKTLTDARADYASLSKMEFDEPVYGSPWTDTENYGEEIYPEEDEGDLCNGHVYDFWELGKYDFSSYAYDKYKWTSQTNVSGFMCSRAVQNFGSYDQWADESEGDILIGWNTWHRWLNMDTPLGAFEDFVYRGIVVKVVYDDDWEPGDIYGIWHPAIVDYLIDWWGTPYPELTDYARYSGNSQLQIYVHHCRYRIRNWTGEGGSDPGDPWVYEEQKQSKIQIHAASSYHPDAEGTGAINADPLGLTRNADLEAALLNLVKTQLQEEDAAAGEDWSFWQLDEDHDPTWPGPAGSTFYDAAASETYQIQLLRWLEFDIEFREYPEE